MSLNNGKHADILKDRKAFFPSRSSTILGLLDPDVENTTSLKPEEMFA
jgi:hypothetical protein